MGTQHAEAMCYHQILSLLFFHHCFYLSFLDTIYRKQRNSAQGKLTLESHKIIKIILKILIINSCLQCKNEMVEAV